MHVIELALISTMFGRIEFREIEDDDEFIK